MSGRYLGPMAKDLKGDSRKALSLVSHARKLAQYLIDDIKARGNHGQGKMSRVLPDGSILRVLVLNNFGHSPIVKTWIESPVGVGGGEGRIKKVFFFTNLVWCPEGLLVKVTFEEAPFGYGFPKRDRITGEKINPPFGTKLEETNNHIYSQVIINKFKNNKYLDDWRHIKGLDSFFSLFPTDEEGNKPALENPCLRKNNLTPIYSERTAPLVTSVIYRYAPQTFNPSFSSLESNELSFNHAFWDYSQDIWVNNNYRLLDEPGLNYGVAGSFFPYGSTDALSFRQFGTDGVSLIYEEEDADNWYVHFPEELLYPTTLQEQCFQRFNFFREDEGKNPSLYRPIRGNFSPAFLKASEFSYSSTSFHANAEDYRQGRFDPLLRSHCYGEVGFNYKSTAEISQTGAKFNDGSLYADSWKTSRPHYEVIISEVFNPYGAETFLELGYPTRYKESGLVKGYEDKHVILPEEIRTYGSDAVFNVKTDWLETGDWGNTTPFGTVSIKGFHRYKGFFIDRDFFIGYNYSCNKGSESYKLSDTEALEASRIWEDTWSVFFRGQRYVIGQVYKDNVKLFNKECFYSSDFVETGFKSRVLGATAFIKDGEVWLRAIVIRFPFLSSVALKSESLALYDDAYLAATPFNFRYNQGKFTTAMNLLQVKQLLEAGDQDFLFFSARCMASIFMQYSVDSRIRVYAFSYICPINCVPANIAWRVESGVMKADLKDFFPSDWIEESSIKLPHETRSVTNVDEEVVYNSAFCDINIATLCTFSPDGSKGVFEYSACTDVENGFSLPVFVFFDKDNFFHLSVPPVDYRGKVDARLLSIIEDRLLRVLAHKPPSAEDGLDIFLSENSYSCVHFPYYSETGELLALQDDFDVGDSGSLAGFVYYETTEAPESTCYRNIATLRSLIYFDPRSGANSYAEVKVSFTPCGSVTSTTLYLWWPDVNDGPTQVSHMNITEAEAVEFIARTYASYAEELQKVQALRVPEDCSAETKQNKIGFWNTRIAKGPYLTSETATSTLYARHDVSKLYAEGTELLSGEQIITFVAEGEPIVTHSGDYFATYLFSGGSQWWDSFAPLQAFACNLDAYSYAPSNASWECSGVMGGANHYGRGSNLGMLFGPVRGELYVSDAASYKSESVISVRCHASTNIGMGVGSISSSRPGVVSHELLSKYPNISGITCLGVL